jgi:DNA-binding response OmpR family regulator
MTSTPLQPIPPKRILVVEDDLVLAQTVRVALALEGHKVEVAGDGEQASAMLEAGRPDLVIADFKLPKMDGLELAQAIKERAPSCPVILITAYAEAVLRTGNVSNVDNLLGKPFSMAQLHGALMKIFPGPSA